MLFQGQGHRAKAKLAAKEHFILANFLGRLPLYLLMWVAAILFALVFSQMPWTQPVVDYAGMRAFSIAFITIATTTITFAIPTCMRAIFSTYEQYYSTKISEILLRRFPVTLLTLSAFTSLLISIAVVSGIIGVAIPVSPAAAFYVALFWTLVCVFYLFVAIEKMVYFIANAPYAVIEKLEYSVGAMPEISTKSDYELFRQELASMNDIASTIISRSTGYDASITEILEAFQQIHAHYLSTADAADQAQFRYHLNACRAVDHEIVRIFRTACSVKNEQACSNIIATYCAMMLDAIETNTGIGYFSDMLEQIGRFQSYAGATSVDEIKILASVSWFFMLAELAKDRQKTDAAKYSLIVRTLSSSLCSATEAGDSVLIVKFLRIASNAEVDYDMRDIGEIWKNLLDRTVFIYATWLIDLIPPDAAKYVEYIKRYSFITSSVFRSVLPDTDERLAALFKYENLLHARSNTSAELNGKTAMLLSLDLENTAAHALMVVVLLDENNIKTPFSNNKNMWIRFSRDISYIRKHADDETISQRVHLASVLDSSVEKYIEEISCGIK